MGSNLLTKTADVERAVSSDPNDETQLHMVNQAQRGQLKVCKALGPNSSDLVNQKFWFGIDTGDRYTSGILGIVAGNNTQCKIYGDLPIGTDVSVDELFAEDHLMPINTASPILLPELPSNAFIDTTGEGTI